MTSRPNSSIDATIASWLMLLVVGLKQSWSAPMSTHRCTALAQSSGSPTTTMPISLAFLICSIVGSGMRSGHTGKPSGLGMLSSQCIWRLV